VSVSSWSVRDELWEVFRELIPARSSQRTGRPRVDDRIVFNAIMYVLITGIAWQHLPREMGCSPATAHRRLQEWQRQGLWQRLHRELLRKLNAAGRIDWSTGVVDGSHIRALRGGSDRALSG
jgi:transposase